MHAFGSKDVANGYTSIFVSGPVERGVLVESSHGEGEDNMWSFTKVALDLLAECIAEAASAQATQSSNALLHVTEDRYGGVEVGVAEAAEKAHSAWFHKELQQGLQNWRSMGKQGVWLKLPLACASFIGPSVQLGFKYHHAKEDYALLTQWLPEDRPSPLPKYAYTQIGVGGVVVNSKNEVLMVQERVSPMPIFQGTWKLPGGMADQGEDFATTVQREVFEETGITGSLVGVVSIRHSHNFRFGQGDLYVLVKLQADIEEIKLDSHELMDARWMSKDEIESLVVTGQESLDGKVSANNWKMIVNALEGSLIVASELANSRGPKPTLLYTASQSSL